MEEHIGTIRMDFDCFCNKLCGSSRRLVHTHYYNVPAIQSEVPDMYKKQQKFYTRLRNIPYFNVHLGRLVPRTKKIQCPKCKKDFSFTTHTEKGPDVALATHMLMYAFDNAYDIAIVVSGDGDFVTSVDEVRRLKKRVENAYFKVDSKPQHLASHCDYFIELNKKYLAKCLI